MKNECLTCPFSKYILTSKEAERFDAGGVTCEQMIELRGVESDSIYMLVTNDVYELPLAVASTVEELAAILGISESAVRTKICRHAKGVKVGKKKFIKVRLAKRKTNNKTKTR